jgi:hypothetical protein
VLLAIGRIVRWWNLPEVIAQRAAAREKARLAKEKKRKEREDRKKKQDPNRSHFQ